MKPVLLVGLALVACADATAPSETGVVFLGDSFVQSFHNLPEWFGPDAATWINHGRGGQECPQLRTRLASDVDSTTRTAVVLIGINDVVLGHVGLADCLSSLADSLNGRSVRPVLVTLLPVTGALNTTRPISADSANGVIAGVNALLVQRAGEHNFVLVNAAALFRGADGNGISALYNADGLHPNAEGLRTLADAIAARLRQVGVLQR